MLMDPHVLLGRRVGEETKKKISSILSEIRLLSDVEKLMLYLQLPTGSSTSEDPLKLKGQNNPLGKKSDEEGTLAITWIQSHLEEDPDVSLPKQEVYDEYQSYCEVTGTEPLCAADFGKVMKQIFPSVKPRRLGTRGNSRYCYSGLRKKVDIQSPTLPDLQAKPITDPDKANSEGADEVLTAACHILFEWAEKLLNTKFTSLKELAAHLIENLFVDNRSVAAYTLLLQLDKAPAPPNDRTETKSKKSEAQLHLQRKIQEKELIKGQKLKLEEHRSQLATSCNNKLLQSRRKGFRNRKSHTSGDQHSKKKASEEQAEFGKVSTPADNIPAETKDLSDCNSTIGSSSEESDKFQQSQSGVQSSDSSGSMVAIKSGTRFVCVDDSGKQKNKSAGIALEKPAVSIAQGIPSFIIVPSLQQVQLSDVGSKTKGKAQSKYKRIQPKPANEGMSSSMRCRTGSLGSALVKESKTRSNGRRSSLALFQSDSSQESVVDNNVNNIRGKDVNSVVKTMKKEFPDTTSAKALPPYYLSDMKIIGEKNNSPLHLKNETLVDDSIAVKRHSEERDFETLSKKPHLDEPGSSDMSSESLSPWAKNTSTTSSSFFPSSYEDESATKKPEGLSICELESDALVDYSNENENLKSHPKVNQLSQLRILLEQNLPHPVVMLQRNSTESANKASVLMHTKDPPIIQTGQLGNLDVSSNFLRTNNSHLNQDVTFSGLLQGNQLNLDVLSSSNITDQDLLAVMTESSTFNKNHPLNVNVTDPSPHNVPDMKQVYAIAVGIERNSTQTQVPSVPPSPNTRRKAFNFMPISPRHTPIPEGMGSSNAHTCFSPVAVQHPLNTVSVAVGPSQPPSNTVSPFVSPRSTPNPPSRSRHSSGQSSYSTSRHTPFQNFDSGVSSISSSPFISPHTTPVPANRLRHNSSHESGKTVTFSTVTNSQVIHTLSSGSGHGALRLRHNSGSTSSHVGFSLLSPRSAPLSPLVNDSSLLQFNFPVVTDSRSRHNSGLNTVPLSPVSEQISPCNISNDPVDIGAAFEANLVAKDPFIGFNSGKEMIGVGPVLKHTRQRHASSSVIYNKSSDLMDPYGQEVQLLLKKGSEQMLSNMDNFNRSRSVPLNQMLQTIGNNSGAFSESQKSYGTLKTGNPSFPMLCSNSSILPLSSDGYGIHCDKSLPSVHNDWNALDGSSDIEMSSARRNIPDLLNGDDLQTTLDDLRDCDTDFSQFTQELDISQIEDTGI